MGKAPTVDLAQIRKIAELARFELTEQEVEVYSAQVDRILTYVSQLEELQEEVKGLEPLFHPLETETYLRDDQVVASMMDAEGNPRVLESAPDVLYQGYRVPPIL